MQLLFRFFCIERFEYYRYCYSDLPSLSSISLGDYAFYNSISTEISSMQVFEYEIDLPLLLSVTLGYFALEGITQLLNSIILVQSNMNPELRIEGVLLTMLDGRTNIGLEIIEEVRKCFKSKVFNTIIPRLVRLVEAPSHGKPISDYDPTSRATLAYQNLAKEVISRNGD